MPVPDRSPKSLAGFTLVELLVSTAIMAMLLAVLLSVTSSTSKIWQRTSGHVEQFRQAREAFETITRRLSQATLNTYWDYDNPISPTNYIRQSDLRFISGPMSILAGSAPSGKSWPAHGIFFQSALGAAQPGQTNLSGLYSLLNTWGYFVEFNTDDAYRPTVLNGTAVVSQARFRLCEITQPSDALGIYYYTSGTDASGNPKNQSYTGHDWFTNSLEPESTRPVHPLADNVVALVLLPKLSSEIDSTSTNLAPAYLYDSTTNSSNPTTDPKNQLPPIVQITMVAIDETSAKRLQSQNGSNAPDLGLANLFQNAGQYDADLQTLQTTLAGKHLSYRIFTTSVRLREAKWSTDQTN